MIYARYLVRMYTDELRKKISYKIGVRCKGVFVSHSAGFANFTVLRVIFVIFCNERP